MDFSKDEAGNVRWSKREASVWKTVYSSEGYVTVDGGCLLLPGQSMIVQVEAHQPLPPQECYHHNHNWVRD
jgi:hypothetical protein